MGPGSMLLAAEYTFGLCLSWRPVAHAATVAWPPFPQKTRRPVAHAATVAWPPFPQKTRRPVAHAADVIWPPFPQKTLPGHSVPS